MMKRVSTPDFSSSAFDQIMSSAGSLCSNPSLHEKARELFHRDRDPHPSMFTSN